MKKFTEILCCCICIVLVISMFSFGTVVFAEEEPIDPFRAEENQKIYSLKIIQSSGGIISVDKTSLTEEEVAEGQLFTITVTPDKGYGVSALYINGKSQGTAYTCSFTPVEEVTEIKAQFHKSNNYVFIMLDAGHYGKINRSPVRSRYYESEMTWALHCYLKKELEAYKNIVVDTTRRSQKEDMEVYRRGKASRGYDLFLSLHSNATGSKNTDYPLIITQKGNTKDPLAVSLGQTIEALMNTKQGYQVWQKLNKDNKTEYYGVLRGSKSVGTKGMILEHSFHTNPSAVKWLSDHANLKKMAEAEAADIAAYYGLAKTGNDTIKPSKPSMSISCTSYNALTLKWKKSIGATGYVIYRASGKNGTYKKIKTITKGTTLTYKNSNLTTGKIYYYKVQPYRKSGGNTTYGSFSSVRFCRVRPLMPSVTSSAGVRKITVRWTKVSGASGYVVYRASTSTGNYQKIASFTKSRRSYTNTGLQKGNRYYYKVRAYRTIKGKRVYSLYSGYTSKTVK